jgi:3-dehydroquinate synthase
LFESFQVNSYRGFYSVKFAPWFCTLKESLVGGDVVVLDKNIAELYPVIAELNNPIILISPSEAAKTYGSIGETMEEVMSLGFSKNNKLIAVGGGITQDITAFAASVIMRGVSWHFYPTNLLSQCDSCIGSKTSVNLGKYKNQLGGFYPPDMVCIDTSFCKTLQPRDFASGLGEMMHYFLIDGSMSLEDLEGMIDEVGKNSATLDELIWKSLHIKKKMVELDEFDQGPRNIFNYGHTFGHALEATTDFQVAHGIAVAYGMDLANFLSVEFGFLQKEVRNGANGIFRKIWSDTVLPEIDNKVYMDALVRDKKSIKGFIQPILTRGIGQMFQAKLRLNSRLMNAINKYFEQRLYEKKI